MNDGHGRHSRLSLWSHPGKDITGMVARSEKVAGTLEEVISLVDIIMICYCLVDGR